MKKDLGNTVALYPTPAIVVGTMVDGKPTWTLAAHIGIPAHDRIMVSLSKAHYINQGVKETKTVSVSIVDEAILAKADYVGCVSGTKTDKSAVFEFVVGETGAPMINDAKLTMECVVEDVYEKNNFENFILEVKHTFAEEEILSENGKVDFSKFKPVLFEFPGYTYLRTGDTIAKCMSLGRELK